MWDIDITVKNSFANRSSPLYIRKCLESELADKLNQKSINSASLCVGSFSTHSSSCVPRSTNRSFPFTPLALVHKECGQRFRFSIWKPALDQSRRLFVVVLQLYHLLLADFLWATSYHCDARQAGPGEQNVKIWCFGLIRVLTLNWFFTILCCDKLFYERKKWAENSDCRRGTFPAR